MIWIAVAGSVAWLALTMTRSRRLMLIGSALLAIAWLAQIDMQRTPAVAKASMIAAPKGSCASIADGMTIAEVKSRVGEPDEVRDDGETRGPGAKMLVYRGSRCTVHLFEERVELVD
jgi:hypothetical protein